MGNLFSGLDKFGLGKLEKMDVFAEEHRDKNTAKNAKQKSTVSEEDFYLIRASYARSVMKNFRQKLSGRARLSCCPPIRICVRSIRW